MMELRAREVKFPKVTKLINKRAESRTRGVGLQWALGPQAWWQGGRQHLLLIVLAYVVNLGNQLMSADVTSPPEV